MTNAAHIHLVLTHLPVVGTLAVGGLLAWAWWRGSHELTKVAFGAAVMVAVLTVPVFLSGQQAEEQIEDARWASERLIDRHEDIARYALIGVLATGALAAVGLWQVRAGGVTPRRTAAAVALAVTVSSAMMGWTANSGGAIRHDEIRTAAATPAHPDHDDD